jgi:hypothetical protein
MIIPDACSLPHGVPWSTLCRADWVRNGSVLTTISGRSCAKSGHYKSLFACRPAAGVTMDRGGNPSISWNSATRAAPDKKRVEHLECAGVDAHRPYDFACGGYVCEVVHTSSRAGAVRSRPVFSLVKALNGS